MTCISTPVSWLRLEQHAQAMALGTPQTLATMWTASGVPQLDSGKPSSYGMGFGVLTVDGQQFIGHSGGQQGTSTYMAFVPGKRFAVAVFADDEDAEPFDVVRGILDLYHMPDPHPKQ